MVQLATATVMLVGMILAFSAGFVLAMAGAKKALKDKDKNP